MVSVCLEDIIRIYGIDIMEFAYGMLTGMWITILIIMTLLRIRAKDLNDQQG